MEETRSKVATPLLTNGTCNQYSQPFCMGNEPFFMHYWKMQSSTLHRAALTGNSEFRSDNYRKNTAVLLVRWLCSVLSRSIIFFSYLIKGKVRGWEKGGMVGVFSGVFIISLPKGLTRLSDSIITKSLRYGVPPLQKFSKTYEEHLEIRLFWMLWIIQCQELGS